MSAQNPNEADAKLAEELVKMEPGQTSPPTQIILEQTDPLIAAKKNPQKDNNKAAK